MCFMERAISTTAAVEEWRPIAGYEGLYEVSSLGRVRSLDKYRKFFDFNGNEHSRLVKGRVRKLQLATNGYYTVSLNIAGRGESRKLVHRLVAEAFVPNPDNLPEVNHKDCCKTNNLPDNLEWCDRVYNVNYADAREKHALLRGRRVEQLTISGEHVAFYDSAAQASRVSNGAFKYSNLNKALSDKRKRTGYAYGYQWRYV